MSENTELKIKNGNLNAFGVDISISDIIGDKLVNQFIGRLSEDDLNIIFKAIEDEIFSHNYNDEKYFVKTRSKDSSVWGEKTEETPIWKTIQKTFHDKFVEIILNKADEILNSKIYQDRADKIAEEIVEYATEGYKLDLKQRIYERMVNNVTNTEPSYNHQSLRYIIQEELAKFTNRY